jgi:hypothetical protein
MVAVVAGRKKSEARALAFYSQMPDEVEDFEALPEVLGSFSEKFGRSFASGAAGLSGAPGKEEQIRASWTSDITSILHSLHGGGPAEVIKRRQCLKQMLQSKTLKLWEQGFIIHALGDAYAHTFLGKDEKWHAFPSPMGHGAESARGRTPDSIGHNYANYVDFVDALYEGLAGQVPPDDAVKLRLSDIKFWARQAGKENWKLGLTGGISDQSMQAESREMQKRAQAMGLGDVYYDPIGGHLPEYYGDRTRSYPKPEKGDVQKLMDKIKDACGIKR